MKRHLVFALGLILATATATAVEPRGTIEITGHGEASADPELAKLDVTVISMCYDTSRDAKNANADLANKILDVLRKYVTTGGKDRVTATGGPNVRQTELIELGGTAGRKILCERKWRATNGLSLHTSALTRLADIQDDILRVVDGVESPAAEKSRQTYAMLGQPVFQLFPETLTRLSAEAQNKAWDHAKAQFAVFAARCAFREAKLTSISRPSFGYVTRSAGVEALGAATPVIPDKLSVQVAWKFVWEFTPSETCQLQ